MKLNKEEKEYLLSLLEWQLADSEGLKEWDKYRLCKNILEKLEND